MARDESGYLGGYFGEPIDVVRKASFHTTKVVYDALTPEEWGPRLPRRSSFRYAYPASLRECIVRDWRLYGFR